MRQAIRDGAGSPAEDPGRRRRMGPESSRRRISPVHGHAEHPGLRERHQLHPVGRRRRSSLKARCGIAFDVPTAPARAHRRVDLPEAKHELACQRDASANLHRARPQGPAEADLTLVAESTTTPTTCAWSEQPPRWHRTAPTRPPAPARRPGLGADHRTRPRTQARTARSDANGQPGSPVASEACRGRPWSVS